MPCGWSVFSEPSERLCLIAWAKMSSFSCTFWTEWCLMSSYPFAHRNLQVLSCFCAACWTMPGQNVWGWWLGYYWLLLPSPWVLGDSCTDYMSVIPCGPAGNISHRSVFQGVGYAARFHNKWSANSITIRLVCLQLPLWASRTPDSHITAQW